MAQSPLRKRITFIATKKVKQPTKVSFATQEGLKVSFVAKKIASRPVKINFYAKKKK